MLELSKFTASLGDLAKQLSKEDILKLRDQQDQMAEIFFNSWSNKISSDKV